MFENKKDRQIIKLPFGFRDILPSETKERNKIKEIIGSEFRIWGYGEVNTPVAEYTKNISIGAGKNWKDKLISFFDVDSSPVSLRSDMTIPIARLAGMRIKKEQLPVRFCYFADSFRQSGTQKGISRVYNQAGIELIGSSTPMVDSEILIILVNILNRLKIGNYTIGLGNVGFIEGLCDWFNLDIKEREFIKKKIITRDFVTLENFLGKKDKGKTKIFIKLMQPESSARNISNLISGIEDEKIIRSFNYIKELYDTIKKYGYSGNLVIDFSIIRDFDYYTGMLFEVYCSDVNNIIGSGGRYDGLIKKFGLDVPATGFALDVDLVHKAIGGLEKEEVLKILLKYRGLKNSPEFIKLVKTAGKLQEAGAVVEMCFEDKDNVLDFVRDKGYGLLVETGREFEKVRIKDVRKNIEKTKNINEFIEEINNGKWN
ncbi:MAG: ATP phosphoribosyltransferase regulatory subunit [Actinomycetota bacterium]|nr:ATP phosphoribosyltransferase regulatory subunit [Actinomycetota bacterium]